MKTIVIKIDVVFLSHDEERLLKRVEKLSMKLMGEMVNGGDEIMGIVSPVVSVEDKQF